MSVTCDFCGERCNNSPDNKKFITGRHGIAICSDCVNDASVILQEIADGIYKIEADRMEPVK